jgi:hypothetical protein
MILIILCIILFFLFLFLFLKKRNHKDIGEEFSVIFVHFLIFLISFFLLINVFYNRVIRYLVLWNYKFNDFLKIIIDNPKFFIHVFVIILIISFVLKILEKILEKIFPLFYKFVFYDFSILSLLSEKFLFFKKFIVFIFNCEVYFLSFLIFSLKTEKNITIIINFIFLWHYILLGLAIISDVFFFNQNFYFSIFVLIFLIFYNFFLDFCIKIFHLNFVPPLTERRR